MAKKKEEKRKPCPNCNPEKGMMAPMYDTHGECRLCKFIFRRGKDGVGSETQ